MVDHSGHAVTAAYLLSSEPYYLREGLQELAPLLERCVFVLRNERISAEGILRQAREVLGSRRVFVETCDGSDEDAVHVALGQTGGGWLLLLGEDECVEGSAFAHALQTLMPESDERYKAHTLFFWHDSTHTVNGGEYRRADEKPRLIWTPSERHAADKPTVCPPARGSEGAPRQIMMDAGLCVFNYSMAVPAEVMRTRVASGTDNSGDRDPADWFSPWWTLGVNRVPSRVKRYGGKHPASMEGVCRDVLIQDAPVVHLLEQERLLVWESWIGQEISLGVVADHTINHLEESGWEPHVYPVDLLGPVSAVPAPTRRAILREAQRREALKRHRRLITVKNSHTGDWMQLQYPKAAVKIGYSPQERTALNPGDVQRANRMDLVMVTSSYVQQVSEASGVRRPFYVYHHGYDPRWLHAVVRPQRPVFTFLAVSVLNLRKGPDILLQVFDEEFRHETDVRLLIKTSPHAWHQDLHEELIARYAGHPRIVFLQGHHTEAEVAQLYYSADCFVLPTRGEGFGLPTLEAMATGLPVITTNWSGHLDFCTSENSYLIDVKNKEQLELAMGCEEWWAAPDEEHLAMLMRRVYENRDEALLRGKRAAEDVAGWTWEWQVSKLNRFLQTLL